MKIIKSKLKMLFRSRKKFFSLSHSQISAFYLNFGKIMQNNDKIRKNKDEKDPKKL